MQIQVVFKSESNPPAIKLARIMHWPERYGMSYTLWHHTYSGRGLENGDPEVMRRITKTGEKLANLSPAIEWWLFGLLKECTFGRIGETTLKQAYSHLLDGNRAYTDYTGWETRQSVVLGSNIGAEWMRMGYGLPNGATVEIVGDEVTIAGKLCTPIRALDVLDPNTLKATYANSPYTIQCATNCVTDPQPSGLVDPFPFLGELGYSTPIPLLAEGQNFIYVESAWLKPLAEGVTGRQYPYVDTNYKTVRW